MIKKVLEEEVATYMVLISDGKDLWIPYEGTLGEALRTAQLKYERNKTKQNYTVEVIKLASTIERRRNED